MTPYEAIDLAQSIFSNSLAAYAVFLSLVSGYLVTAYMVGSELSRIQVRLLTLLFLVVVAVLTWSMSAYAYWGDVFTTMARGEDVERSVMDSQSWLPALSAAINVLTVVACLFFMWNVRHPKQNDDK
jgi:hypothetical protein